MMNFLTSEIFWYGITLGNIFLILISHYLNNKTSNSIKKLLVMHNKSVLYDKLKRSREFAEGCMEHVKKHLDTLPDDTARKDELWMLYYEEFVSNWTQDLTDKLMEKDDSEKICKNN